MKTKNILVTGIGGNVAWGILRNLRALPYDLFVVGCNIKNFSAGNHLCDAFHKVPYAYEEGYVDAINKIVDQHKIDLIIPSTDYEVYYLAANKKKINCKIAVSSADATGIYLDKHLSALHHHQNEIPFAESILPSHYKAQFKDCIVKPRKGRGSRGLVINPKDLSAFNDNDHVIQRFHRGKEITTAFYITKKKYILGHITMERTLENGATNQCKVVYDHDKLILPIIEKMNGAGDLWGSVNIQSIIDENTQQIIPFEVNCRISGTNSIRSHFGFSDVKYLLQEALYDEAPEKPIIKKGAAVRMLTDVIYPDADNFDQLNDNRAKHFLF